jgi:hypothetical protein
MNLRVFQFCILIWCYDLCVGACRWEEKLQTSHLPEMVFGESCLVLKHLNSGTKIHFNAFDALTGWKQEALPPVEVPAAAKWKFRRYCGQIGYITTSFNSFYGDITLACLGP